MAEDYSTVYMAQWNNPPSSGNPLQYCCLRNPMNRGAWQATVHGVTESDTPWQLNNGICVYHTFFIHSSVDAHLGCISHFQGLKRHMWLMVTMWADVAREDGGEQAKGIRGPWEHRESCRVHSSETRTPGRFWTGQVLDLIQDYFGCCAKINGEEAGSYLEMH